MKKSLLLILTLILIFPLRAENSIPRHGVTAHIGGSLALVECEYQYRFIVKDKHAFSATVGINSAAVAIGFPIGINYTYGNKNQLLLGLRFIPSVLVISFDNDVEVPQWVYFANLRIGYGREITLFKQPCTLYAYVSPAANLNGTFLPWAGIGLTQYF
jgi:hypothetical protein